MSNLTLTQNTKDAFDAMIAEAPIVLSAPSVRIGAAPRPEPK